MIVVTGGAGFIGSAMIWELNQLGIENILVVDELGKSEKWKNLINLKFYDYIEKDYFLDNIFYNSYEDIEKIYHFGACSSTQEVDASYLIENNFEYTKILARYCKEKSIDFIYASSAATYGDGENGYSDENIKNLKPLNMYGYSKQLFDLYAENCGFFDDEKYKIIGLKFFNVYGPNENHKGEMRSMVNKAFYQIKQDGEIKLFKSYNSKYNDGEQKRDFIYVKDATKIAYKLATLKSVKSGVYNVGTGAAFSWNELAKAIFLSLNLNAKIKYVEMPDILQKKYQYFTRADMSKTFGAINNHSFFSLEEAVKDYVVNYLSDGKYLGE